MAGTLLVGLTGGIGSGKSSAARILEDLGAAIVDTDEIAHELTRPGGAAIGAIRSAFGDDYVTADGSLARSRMRQLVFADAAARARLEAILHPLIREEVRRRVASARGAYIVIVVPLLLETGAYRDLTDRLLVVDCSEELQVSRTMARSGLAEAEVRAIMSSQVSRAARLAAADDVLRNDSNLDALRREAQALHQRYLALVAANRAAPGHC